MTAIYTNAYTDARVIDAMDERYIGNDLYLIDGEEYEEDEAREILYDMFCEMDDIDAAWYDRWN